MNRRQTRLAKIVDILLSNSIGSQEELLEHLMKRNCKVTQATLSRDLKALRTSKVPDEMGGYRYVISQQGAHADNVSINDLGRQQPILGVGITGTTVVIRTRDGYAGSVAYDLDQIDSPLILGTVAGINNVFVAVDEKAERADIYKVLHQVLPGDMSDGFRKFSGSCISAKKICKRIFD